MSFTSDLSVDEVLLIEEAGFEPLEFVMGSSYFHLGWAPTMWSVNQELTTISALMLRARWTAMQRLIAQAQQVGADGVVGMNIEIEREGHHAEFAAIGTAVRRRAGDGGAWRTRHGHPFTCNLSGKDFWALVRGGYRPVSLAHGVCVYHVAHQSLKQWLSTNSYANYEHPQFTQALYDARELAMERVQYEAQQAGATGVVGVRVEEGSHGWSSHIIEFCVFGSGVIPIVDERHETHEPPKAVMNVCDE